VRTLLHLINGATAAVDGDDDDDDDADNIDDVCFLAQFLKRNSCFPQKQYCCSLSRIAT
jgi:hypothetical protein